MPCSWKKPMPQTNRQTNSERPQARRQNVLMSRELTAARETVQARRDPTAESRQWQESWQDGLAQAPARGRVGGNPDNPGQPDVGAPWKRACMLATGTVIVDMAWDAVDRVLAVGYADDTVNFWRQYGSYWHRIDDVSIPITTFGIAKIALNNGGLWLGGTNGSVYWPNWRDFGNYTILRGSKPVAGLVWDVNQDSSDWPALVSASYQSESVPSGRFLGRYADLTSAIAAGGTVGDWYLDSTADNWQEITGVGTGADNLLTWSEEFDNAAWTKQNTTITANAAVAPDGTQTADQAVPATALDARVLQTVTAGDGVYTGSYYVKADGLTQFFSHIVERNPTGQEVQVAIDLNAGTATYASGTLNLIDSDVVSVGDGWFRVVLTTETVNGSADVEFRPLSTTTGDGLVGVFLWGAQLVTATLAPDVPVAAWNFNAGNRRVFRDTFPEQSTTVLNDTFSSSNRVFTDSFSRVNPAPWTANANGITTIESHKLRTENDAAQGTSNLQSTLVVGQWYRVTGTLEDGSTSGSLGVGTTVEGIEYGLLTATGEVIFQATSADLYLTHFCGGGGLAGLFCYLDDIVIERLGALDGWTPVGAVVSLNGNSMTVDNDGAVSGASRKAFEATAGRTYTVRATVSATTSNPLALIRVRNTALAVQVESATSNDPTSFEVTFTAAATETHYVDCANASSADASISEWSVVSIDELPVPQNWTAGLSGVRGPVWVDNSTLHVENNTPAAGGNLAVHPETLDVTKWYKYSADVIGATTNAQLSLSDNADGSSAWLVSAATTPGNRIELTFKPQQAATTFNVNVANSGDGAFVEVDNVLIEEVPALEDWDISVAFPDAEPSKVNNRLQLLATDGVLQGRVSAPFTTTVGEAYVLTYTAQPSPGCSFAVANNANLQSSFYAQSINAGGDYSTVFTSPAGPLWCGLINDPTNTSVVDDIVVSTAKSVIPDYSATTDADASVQIYRAGQADFPSEFVVDATANEVVIYDVTDVPTMWMVFEQGASNFLRSNVTALAYADSQLHVTCDGIGTRYCGFSDEAMLAFVAAGEFAYGGNIAQRNDGLAFTLTDASRAIVNDVVNDVASEVLSKVDVTNLCEDTEDNTGAFWTVATGIGTVTETVVTDDTSNGLHQFGRAANVNIGGTVNVTFSVDLQYLNCEWAFLSVSDGISGQMEARVNLLTGSHDFVNVQNVGSWKNINAAVHRVGDRWRCSLSGLRDDTGNVVGPRVALSTDGERQYQGTGTTQMLMTRWQLEASATPHDYVPNTGNVAATVFADDFSTPYIQLFADSFNREEIAPWTQSGSAYVIDDRSLYSATTGTDTVTYFSDTLYKAGDWYRCSGVISEGTSFCGAWDTGPTTGELSDSAASRSGEFEFFFQPTNDRAAISFFNSTGPLRIERMVIEAATALNGWEPSASGKVAIASGELKATGTASFHGGAIQVPVVTGRTYRFRGLQRAGSVASRFQLTDASGTVNNLEAGSTFVEFTNTFVAATDNLSIACYVDGNGDAFFDNIFVELLEDGIGQVPPAKQLRNRTNDIPNSNAFAGTDWVSQNTTQTFDSETSPAGVTSTRILHTDTSAQVSYRGDITWLTRTVSVYVKPDAGSRFFRVTASNNTFTERYRCWFDLRDVVPGTESSDGTTTGSPLIRELDDGWFLCAITLTAPSTQTTSDIGFGFYAQDGSFVSLTTSGGLISGSQSEPETSPTKYILTGDTGLTITEDYGLFVPTWAVAVGTGLGGALGSCGLDSGTIADYLQGGNDSNDVEFVGDDLLWNYATSTNVTRIPVKAEGSTTVSSDPDARSWANATEPNIGDGVFKLLQSIGSDSFSYFGSEWLGILDDTGEASTDATAARITDTYNTGPMIYVDGAWANDNASAALGFPWILFEDFDAPAVPIIADSFQRTTPPPWYTPDPVRSKLTMIDNRLRVENVGGVGFGTGAVYVGTSTTPTWYRVFVDFEGGDAYNLAIVDNPGFTGSTNLFTAQTGDKEAWFEWTGDLYFGLVVNSGTVGDASNFNSVLIERYDALDGVDSAGIATSDISLSNGELVVTRNATSGAVFAAIDVVGAVTGNDYIVGFDTAGGFQRALQVLDAADGILLSIIPDLAGSGAQAGQLASVTWPAGGARIRLRADGLSTGQSARWDNITLQQSLVENGTFDADLSGWNAGAGWAWSAGTALHTAGNTAELQYGITRAEGTPTWTEVKVVGLTAGSVTIAFGGGVTAGVISTNGTFRFAADWGTNASLLYRIIPSSSFDGAIDYAVLGDALPDNSGQGNHGQVIGQVTREKFNRCTYGVCCDDINYVRLTGSAGDELQGWRRDNAPGQSWYFFEDADDVPEIEKAGDDYLLKDGCYAHLMLSGVPVALAALTTESGDFITTEGGDVIVT